MDPAYGQAKAGRPARTYIQQLCEDTGCSPQDLPKTMNDREKWRERIRDIHASGSTWWWRWYIYMVHSISFQTFLYRHLKFHRLLKIHYVIAIHLMRWLTNFYDFIFKWTATAAIGIHPTKAWLLQLVIFKNAIWTWGHIRRTICNKIVF